MNDPKAISDDEDSSWLTASEVSEEDQSPWSDDERDPNFELVRDGTTNIQAALPKTTASSKNKYCLYLTQGAGGIYNFPTKCRDPFGKLHKTTTICLTGCITCVGV